MTTDLDTLRGWIGRSERRTDVISPVPLAALAATLDRDEPYPLAGDVAPPLAHWLYFWPLAPQHEIGPDGHPRRGGFLPPVALPRRMWAGGRFEFLRPLRVGEAVERVSEIVHVDVRQGRSGPLVFVTVRHRIGGEAGPALVEEHDIVYRDLPAPGAPEPAAQPVPADAAFRRRIEPDPVLLFRYSALTFNGHRIHYDRSYVTQVEGYPGLIVHGPLVATLLLDALRRHRPGREVTRFEFRAVRPLFDIAPFEVCGRDDGAGRFALWAADDSGALAMQATAALAP